MQGNSILGVYTQLAVWQKFIIDVKKYLFDRRKRNVHRAITGSFFLVSGLCKRSRKTLVHDYKDSVSCFISTMIVQSKLFRGHGHIYK